MPEGRMDDVVNQWRPRGDGNRWNTTALLGRNRWYRGLNGPLPCHIPKFKLEEERSDFPRHSLHPRMLADLYRYLLCGANVYRAARSPKWPDAYRIRADAIRLRSTIAPCLSRQPRAGTGLLRPGYAAYPTRF